MNEKEILDEFDKRIEEYVYNGGFWCEAQQELGVLDRDIVRAFISKALSEQRKTLINEVVELSDKIEAEGHTEFNEWRAFKAFRNTLRDKYIIQK